MTCMGRSTCICVPGGHCNQAGARSTSVRRCVAACPAVRGQLFHTACMHEMMRTYVRTPCIVPIDRCANQMYVGPYTAGVIRKDLVDEVRTTPRAPPSNGAIPEITRSQVPSLHRTHVLLPVRTNCQKLATPSSSSPSPTICRDSEGATLLLPSVAFITQCKLVWPFQPPLQSQHLPSVSLRQSPKVSIHGLMSHCFFFLCDRFLLTSLYPSLILCSSRARVAQ
jgi:hypothetical protein